MRLLHAIVLGLLHAATALPGAFHWDRASGSLRLGGVHVPRRPSACFALPVPDVPESDEVFLRKRPEHACSANSTRHDRLSGCQAQADAARRALSSVGSAILHAESPCLRPAEWGELPNGCRSVGIILRFVLEGAFVYCATVVRLCAW